MYNVSLHTKVHIHVYEYARLLISWC